MTREGLIYQCQVKIKFFVENNQPFFVVVENNKILLQFPFAKRYQMVSLLKEKCKFLFQKKFIYWFSKNECFFFDKGVVQVIQLKIMMT